MIKAVLLDMDNTLLANPDRAFASAFLQQFESHVGAALATNKAASTLRTAIVAMSNARSGDETNTALTQRILQERTGCPADSVQQALDSYYAEAYLTLRDCISPVTGAVDFIQQLRAAGYAVVIATNPLYPRSAILQRMAWAGLPTDDDMYALITNADNMHFAKPDPAYYAEVIARVGVEPDEALMIGDSHRNDIHPAQTVGLHTYHVPDDTSLQDVHDAITPLLAAPPHRELTPAMIDPQLRGNIGALHGMLANIEPRFWHQRPDPDEWSIMQVLCHLADAERTHHRPRLEHILAAENPFITAPKPPGPDLTVYNDDGLAIAQEFQQERQQTLDLLATLNDDAWQRPARHSIFGLTTLLEMAYFTAQHDRLHLNQLCQTIGRCV